MSSSQLVVSQAVIAKVFSVSTRTIQRWHDEGFPRREDASYDIAECVAWALERERAEQQPRSDEEAYYAALARKTAAQADKAELELAERRRQLIPVAVHERRCAAFAERANALIAAIPGRWAPHLLKIKTVRQAQARLRPLVQELLQEQAGGADDVGVA